jgi:hypothetical protein
MNSTEFMGAMRQHLASYKAAARHDLGRKAWLLAGE